MNAKEMFEALGYTVVINDKKVVRYENNGNVITFYLTLRMFNSYDAFLNKRPKMMYMDLLKAINKQCEELGGI